MDKTVKRILYSVVGFLGGMMLMGMLIPESSYRIFFIILAGIFLGFIGYKIVNK